MSNNPVFNRIERDGQKGYAGFGSTSQATTAYAAQAQMSPHDLQTRYDMPSAGPVDTGRVTMDDVIMKTLAQFVIVLGFGAVAWVLTDGNQSLGLVLTLVGIVVTLGLGFAISRMNRVSVPLIIGYAAVEGVFVGAVSSFYNQRFGDGIVLQAVLATLAVFAGMFLAYKSGLIKVTAKFRRIMTMALFGYLIFAVVNVIYAVVANQQFGIGGNSALGIGISLFATGLAAFTLALDFDSIDRAIATGAPAKYSWLLAHGLIVTIVWLYLEMLRLLARMRD